MSGHVRHVSSWSDAGHKDGRPYHPDRMHPSQASVDTEWVAGAGREVNSTVDRRRWLDEPARWGPTAVVGVAVLFGLIVLWPERADVWYLNDASVHRSMVGWAADEGSATGTCRSTGRFPIYPWGPVGSITTSHCRTSSPAPCRLVGGDATFRWSLYLLLAFWPVSVYAGGRLLGLGRWPAAAAALIPSPLLSSVPGLGYEWGSYVWRGCEGTWAQLWGMWALPFAWGLCWQAITKGKRLWLAALVLGFTNYCVHLLTGYLALCCVGVFVVVAPREIRATARDEPPSVVAGALLASAWMLVPLLTDAGWTVNDEFSRGTIYYDSFGARKILVWLGTGDLLDRGRLPLITILAGVGLVFAIVQSRRREPPRVLIGLGLVVDGAVLRPADVGVRDRPAARAAATCSCAGSSTGCIWPPCTWRDWA